MFPRRRHSWRADQRIVCQHGIDDGLVFRGLVERAILRDAGNGRYYLDEPSWVAHNTMRRRRAFIVLAVVILAGIVTILAGASVVRLH